MVRPECGRLPNAPWRSASHTGHSAPCDKHWEIFLFRLSARFVVSKDWASSCRQGPANQLLSGFQCSRHTPCAKLNGTRRVPATFLRHLLIRRSRRQCLPFQRSPGSRRSMKTLVGRGRRVPVGDGRGGRRWSFRESCSRVGRISVNCSTKVCASRLMSRRRARSRSLAASVIRRVACERARWAGATHFIRLVDQFRNGHVQHGGPMAEGADREVGRFLLHPKFPHAHAQPLGQYTAGNAFRPADRRQAVQDDARSGRAHLHDLLLGALWIKNIVAVHGISPLCASQGVKSKQGEKWMSGCLPAETRSEASSAFYCQRNGAACQIDLPSKASIGGTISLPKRIPSCWRHLCRP